MHVHVTLHTDEGLNPEMAEVGDHAIRNRKVDRSAS